MNTWSHYLHPPLKRLFKFDPKVLAEHRGFDPSPEAIWLGPKLLYRSLHSLFCSIRKLYHSYNPTSFLPDILVMLSLCMTIPFLLLYDELSQNLLLRNVAANGSVTWLK